MEIGHLAFRTILIHHTAYEVARFGSLTAKPDYAVPECAQPQLNTAKMTELGQRILDKRTSVLISERPTLVDQQESCSNYDVEVTIEQAVPLIFPMTGLVLGKACDGTKTVIARCISGAVRMPIERPLFWGTHCTQQQQAQGEC